jgi:hypothetical protein
MKGQMYDFISENNGYRVVVKSVFGKAAQGMATLQGNVVTLTIKNVLGVTSAGSLTLTGDLLVGTLKTLGLPWPVVLSRG